MFLRESHSLPTIFQSRQTSYPIDSRSNFPIGVEELADYGSSTQAPAQSHNNGQITPGDQDLNDPTVAESPTLQHQCTLCHSSITTQLFSFPPTAFPAALTVLNHSSLLVTRSPSIFSSSSSYRSASIFCEDCWKRIHDLSICWACGEVVYRPEEKVGFGWCWWH